ncbi:MAG: glycosyltransferase family 4 protein [Actinomycetota bacterium]|nr:glycosyltransferase family 4 protein [Actinomycetota bacterium]
MTPKRSDSGSRYYSCSGKAGNLSSTASKGAPLDLDGSLAPHSALEVPTSGSTAALPADAIRVLRVIARMNVGGPAVQVVGLTEGLRPPRFQTRLLVGKVDPGEADYLQLRAPHIKAVRVHGLGRAPDPGSDILALRTIAREIRRFRPHIVHTHTAKAGLLGRVGAIVSRVPATVHTFHGHLLYGYFAGNTQRGIVRAERILARSTTRLVAVGRQVRDDLVAAGIGRPEQYVIVPPGVSLPPAPPRELARDMLGLGRSGSVVGYVARLTAVKRPDRFIAAAKELASRQADVTFVVAGEGELLADVRARAAPLGAGIRFLGWRRDVETIYAACDVVVLTSDNEGMPVSLIEASAMGTPAVTTNVGSAAEVVIDGETGFVTTSSPSDIAAAVERILSSEALRRRMGDAAKDRAQRHFSTQRLVADTALLYEEIAHHLRTTGRLSSSPPVQDLRR